MSHGERKGRVNLVKFLELVIIGKGFHGYIH